MTRRLGTLVLSLLLVAACTKRKAKDTALSPEVSGLAAVPATAQVVISADVGKLADSPIIARAVERLLLSDPKLAESWTHVQESCKIDPLTQIKHVMLAIGPAQGGGAGTGPVLMVATGSLNEPDLSSCIRTMVGKGGGSLTAKSVVGRSIYTVQDGNRTMHFAFSRPDTVVMGTNEGWVVEALGTGAKATANPDLQAWLKLIDQRSPVWAVGRVDPRVGQGLVTATAGKLTKQPEAFVATVDPRNGAAVLLGVVMKDAESAKTLESWAKTELAVVGMAAQMKSLGSVVAKVTVIAEQSVVRFRAALTMDEVNRLLSVLDEKPSPEQGSPP
ncbi:MAG: hypothetical protein H0T89_29145 [Deltaproteobacteria bacterium]|nr:hypothetical protein [Deltaproteobacteria bacterium]